MRTPCQSNPEPWVSDHPAERAAAMRDCGPCPRKADCLTEAITGGVTFGVWGGRDFTRSKTDEPPVLDCLFCGAALVNLHAAGPRRKYCTRKCLEAHRYAQRKEVAA